MTMSVLAIGLNAVLGINAQTGTTYTLALTDANGLVKLSNAAAIACTVPPNSSVAIPIGSRIEIEQEGLGVVTVGPGSGVTINAPGSLTTSAQYSKIILLKIATDQWLADVKAASNVIARAAAANDIVSTATKTAAFSFSVPANTLGTDKVIKIELWGDYLNNSGSTQILTLECAFGATVIWADASTAQTASATRHAWRWVIYLSAQNATNAQALGGYFQMSNITGATTGIGDLSVSLPTNATVMNTPFSGTAAEDSTAAKTFAANITHAASNASLSFRVRGAIAFMLGEGQKGDTGATGAAGAAGGVTSPVAALSTSGTVNIDCSLGNYFTLTPSGNVTSITFSNLPAAGTAQTILLKFTQVIGTYTVAWPASFKWAGGVAGAVSSVSGKKDLIAFTTHDQGTTWFASIANDFS